MMLNPPVLSQIAIELDILTRVRALIPGFAMRVAESEETRRIPSVSAQELLEAGIPRVLVPRRFGGYELGLHTWFDIVREISRVDASHGWCASLMIHHAHVVAQFPEAAQEAVWAAGPDVAIAASIMPKAQVTRADGGFRVSGQSAFASGVGHSAWAIVGGCVREEAPEWTLFLIPPGQFKIVDSWFTAGMRGTGSDTIVTENVFVPREHALKLSDLRDGCGPGAELHRSAIFRMPFFSYAPLTFVTPMLGAAQGAYEYVRDWTKTRAASSGATMADVPSVQVRIARVAADLDAAELLLRRSVQLDHSPGTLSPQLLARSARDFARAAELVVAATDALIGLCGTAGFATSHPVQRVWRDIHFASMHVTLNAENNYAHFGRIEFDLGRDPRQPFF